jgi:CRP-like cAMP-binding protein
VCSSLDAAELQEFEHLGRRVHFDTGETVFSEEDITTSFYNVGRCNRDRRALLMSRQDIADYFGLSIETVSRTFTKLERHGAIEILHGGSACLIPRGSKRSPQPDIPSAMAAV